LKKSALSNHLTKLVHAGLILKPDHNKYQLTPDGELFIRTLETTYKKSEMREKKGTEVIQSRQFSESFVESFFS
jgi:predicted transcriptional regulator